jgi:hypothetical protein
MTAQRQAYHRSLAGLRSALVRECMTAHLGQTRTMSHDKVWKPARFAPTWSLQL